MYCGTCRKENSVRSIKEASPVNDFPKYKRKTPTPNGQFAFNNLLVQCTAENWPELTRVNLIEASLFKYREMIRNSPHFKSSSFFFLFLFSMTN